MARFLKLTVLVFVGAIVTTAGAFYVGSQPPSAPPEAQPEGPHGEGTFGPYRFVYMSRNDTYVAVFTPFLAHDDTTLVGAVRAVVRAIYSADLSLTTPAPAGREIAFAAPNGSYFVLPVKQEDSGQVHSLVVRFSPR